jgi:hypothetical protein
VLGSTRATGYFQTVAGQCLLSLIIAEVVDPDRAAPESAARLRFAMQPGQAAVVGSEEGPEMLLTCGAKAATCKSRARKRSHDCASQTSDVVQGRSGRKRTDVLKQQYCESMSGVGARNGARRCPFKCRLLGSKADLLQKGLNFMTAA